MVAPNPHTQRVQKPGCKPNSVFVLVLTEPVRSATQRSQETGPRHTAVRCTACTFEPSVGPSFLFIAPSDSRSDSRSVFFSEPNSPGSFLTGWEFPSLSASQSSLWDMSPSSPTKWNPELNKVHPYHGVTPSEKNMVKQSPPLFCTSHLN